MGVMVIKNYMHTDESNADYQKRVEDGRHREHVTTKVFEGDDCIKQFFTWLARSQSWLEALNYPQVSHLPTLFAFFTFISYSIILMPFY